MTLYDVLCVPQSAELGEVKKAYREKVRIYHPDICPAEEKEKSSKMFLLVQEAYETLSDPMLRVDYDLKLLLNPKLLLSQRRNVKQKNWAEQIESLRMRSRSGERKTWGEKMRRSREEMAAH
ncbi:chaperone protein dnaJ 20, chloroplastic-like [Cryptomeria japonica]|uniref:chaperone protein dnaJ 20, chloroplastic-like n=1 Tax=Cryptomeria japonica TaxID=3369 RepID=UPI0025AC50CA|nr:chaperone protein dnaJ 20, chloroplastic-like [Cryptomeria japonica]